MALSEGWRGFTGQIDAMSPVNVQKREAAE